MQSKHHPAVTNAAGGTRSMRPLLTVTALAVSLGGYNSQVAAQSVTDESAVTGTLHASSADAGAGTHLSIGAGAAYLPRYEGSDQYRYRAVPLLNYRNGRFFAGGLGLGYNVSPIKSLQFGPVLSYRASRYEHASARLRGLGDINGGADVGGYVRWQLRAFSLSATVKRGIGGDAAGTHISLGAGYRMRLSTADRLAFGVSADWADSKIMQAYFGVDALQSARSGLPVYTVGSGLRRYGTSAAWTHSFDRHWFSTVSVSVYRLGNGTANSPIVDSRTGRVAMMLVGYRF